MTYHQEEQNTQVGDRAAQLEAVLFLKGDQVEIEELAELLGCSSEEVDQALEGLQRRLSERSSGLSLIRSGSAALLATDPGLGSLIQQALRYEQQKELGRAGRETLAIILHYHPIDRQDIDYIRGVNSASILRTLAARGLVEKKVNAGGLAAVYYPSTDLLAHLGVNRVQELPEFEVLKERIGSLLAAKDSRE